VVLLGCIADDFTGATDLADTLARGGMRTVQLIETPEAGPAPAGVDAVVIALKTRTVPAAEAVERSLGALRWLRDAGARQVFFKYCSTFDSTDAGNIGPVADALLEALRESFTVACPAFPENGRTVYQGHLFVGDQLLSDSPMRHHPLTPMTDSNLVRVLGRQTRHRVGLIPYATVAAGSGAIRRAIDALRREGSAYAIVDALDGAALDAIGEACADLRLVTGGSGVARGLPHNFRRRGLLAAAEAAPVLGSPGGRAAVLAGSCSAATLAQVAAGRGAWPSFAVDPMALASGADVAAEASRWAEAHLARGPILIYSTAPPDEVARVQAALGRDRAGALVEGAFAAIAASLVDLGVRRLVVAGGETAGAVVKALGIHALRIGPPIEPGVPWTLSVEIPPIALALKSGNFGTPEFFSRALEMMR